GGPRLAFAMAKAMHLPSVSTVHSRLHLPQLLPCPGSLTDSVVSANIESNFKKPASRMRAGLSFMIDELALEPRLRYSIQQDAVVGLCREHAHRVSLDQMSTRDAPVEALLEAKSLLDKGECHRAKEATMVAIARFGQSDYNASVILASGTCKTEKAPEQARLIELVLKCWRDSPYGEALHGEIWSACTDGDAGRRLAMFQQCMSTKLSSTSYLYLLIGHLPLLNLYCGPTQITHDGDYKHEEKSEYHVCACILHRS
ncbi:hypothetical protein BDV93DRAFT_440423, partial [Ceratobasidium sp. AG-I]